MELKDLKRNYGLLQKKYRLPLFEELNGDFEIEKIEKESDFLLRIVRKVIMEKVVNSLSFLDMLLNPMNAPRIYHSYIKGMSADDRKLIGDIYSILGDLSIHSIGMEIKRDEGLEAELIKDAFERWQKVKPKFEVIMENMKKPNSEGEKREKGYFG